MRCGATRTGFKPNECGLAKASSFTAICTKHKASLQYIYDAFPRRGNSAQQHLNEITEIKQGKAVQLIFDFEMKESQTKQHDRAILKQNITYLEQILLIATESSSNFPTRGKHRDYNALEAIADETT